MILLAFTTTQPRADAPPLDAFAPSLESLRGPELPRLLAPAVAARYERIFALQAEGDWSAADGEIARLHDPLLLGQVLAQRYLAKTYHSSYPELVAWLQRYADEPDARAIYGLARHRQPHGAKAPPRPIETAALAEDGAVMGDSDRPAPSPRATLVARQISSLADTAPGRAETLLRGPEARRLLDEGTRTELSTFIAQSYIGAGEPQAARAIGAPAGQGLTPDEHWKAGLAAWRLGLFGDAREHFQALARSADTSPWLTSAGAFWAARVALRLRQRAGVTHWLRVAAAHPRTLYGLIAGRLLGTDTDLDFAAEPFTALDARVVMGFAAGRRALALLQVNERARAADELRALAGGHNPALLQSLAGLADRANLAALSLEIAGALADSDGRNHDRVLYPLPRWTPQGGFTVDRALLFALMRQESLFVPHVTSTSGAEGLMQLMPATARDMAERAGLVLSARGQDKEERAALAKPELNLTLAQEYVRLLLADEHIKGNLLLFALAYNSGPATVRSWQWLATEYRHDPLLFLESIPSHEARVFAKHVLTNYWIYRERLGQPTHDLDELAAGKWPTYIALDPGPEQDGRYAENR
jgi:soluble lytic murein transglycosylase-like protein